MKIISRILYVTFTLIIGFIVISDAQLQKVQDFYYDKLLNTLESGEYTDYIDDTMVILGTNRYLIEPVYRYDSNDKDYRFKVLVMHAQTFVKGEYESSLIFYIRDFETTSSDVDGVSFTFKTNISNINAELLMNFKFKDKLYNGGVLEKVVIEDNQTFTINDYNSGSVNLLEIKEIDLKTFSVDSNNDIVKSDRFAVIKNNEDFNLEISNEFQFVKRNSILESANFTGQALNYETLDERYENNNSFLRPDIEKLKAYNGVVTKTFISYIVVVIIITYLAFFLTPTINKFKNNKENKSKDID